MAGSQGKVSAAGGVTIGGELRRLLLPMLMVVLVLASAIAVIYVTHINRRAFGEYQLLLNARDELETEWGQLLLEQSALASYARVERIATKRLGMRVPKSTDIIMVQQ